MQRYHSKIALLGNLIDYAGTFAPASLPLKAALEEASKFRREGHHPWLMSRVTLPLADIKGLTAKTLYETGSDGGPWLLTALGNYKEGQKDEFLSTLEWDLRELRHFNDRCFFSSVRQWIVAYETKVPETIVKATDLVTQVTRMLDRCATLMVTPSDLFLELDPQSLKDGSVIPFLNAVAYWVETNPEFPLLPGLKIRMVGEKALTKKELAQVLFHNVKSGLRFKATQGLHSPLTHGSDLGFVNLFSALTLATSLGTDAFGADQIEACLSDTSAKNFVFKDESFSWKTFQLTASQIESARRQHHATFGSCSLREPDESLREVFP